MASTPAVQLSKLQQNQHNIRNICILAHVDHGKTTLADSLISSNGIISQRLAGKLRYMDTREDEQKRGITMKSSSISLIFKEGIETYLINLIDSPGHVDFSSEVSTAVCLCDGALILVDVVEGVCSQTLAALRQAWDNGVKPCLVLNKIDRLVSTLQLSPADAYSHLQKIIEKVNAMVANLIASDQLQQEENESAEEKTGNTKSEEEADAEEAKLYFSPELENVAFSSAIHGWAFRLSDFANAFSERLGIETSTLQQALWGDNYMNMKTKSIVEGAGKKGKVTLFVQIILNPIWEVYNAVTETKDAEKVAKIVKSLNLKLSSRDTQLNNPTSCLSAIFRQWLPLSRTVLSMVCQHVPSPLKMDKMKVMRLLRQPGKVPINSMTELNEYETACLKCNSNTTEAPTIAYVSKLFSVPKTSFASYRKRDPTSSQQPSTKDDNETNIANENAHCECEEQFLGFARVFSGSLQKGQMIYVFQPHSKRIDTISTSYAVDSSEMSDEITVEPVEVQITGLFIMMGRDLAEVEFAPSGSVVAISGLENHVWKTATLSTAKNCPPMLLTETFGLPVVRVAIEPKFPSELPRLIKGLKLLSQSDPCANIYIQETGEYVIAAAGEVHLKKCIDDLQAKFADVELNVSDPIVPFRETIISRPKIDMVNEDIIEDIKKKFIVSRLPKFMQKEIQEFQTGRVENKAEDQEKESANKNEPIGVVTITTPNEGTLFKIRALPMSVELLKFLDDYGELLQRELNKSKSSISVNNGGILEENSHIDVKKILNKHLDQLDIDSQCTTRDIWAIGPKGKPSNLLINMIPDDTEISSDKSTESVEKCFDLRQYDNSVTSGFQLAVSTGPMCEEPVRGVCFIISEWSTCASTNSDINLGGGSMAGQILSTVKEGCRRAFMLQPMRLVVAMYSCQIQAASDVLGRMYAVVGKRNGRIIKEDILEGTDIFSITALIPVADSFGFAEEIRKKTSGLASPQLVFSHWETLDIDPFWIPTTDEEYLHFGDKADSENIALKYVNKTRVRKGLYVEEKTVEHAEKQRTLKKNK